MSTVIQVDRVSKEYRLGQIGGKRLADDVNRWWARFRGKEDPLSKVDVTSVESNGNGHKRTKTPSVEVNSLPESEDHIWALKEVSFDVKEGEVLGVIGKNGAGKSTLLKILSRVTAPTSGEVRVKGRIASLLEVGTGFHPELTGRENIFLNGAILGMTKAEIKKKFDEIVDFSEVEKFIDTPVKRYSSGMYVRLAFGVAAHLDPEILIIDEVLAVGDAAFQKKCLGKMNDVASQGRTILFVSHNMIAVKGLCQRCVWLKDGKVVEDGPSHKVAANYLKTTVLAMAEKVWSDISSAPGNEKVRLHRACVRPLEGSVEDITVRTLFALDFEFWNLEPDAYLNLSLIVLNEEGVQLFNTGPIFESKWNGRPFPVGLFRSTCFVPGDLLNDGLYRVQLLIVKDRSVIIFKYDDALVFEVHEAIELRKDWYGKWPGVMRPNLEWSTELITSDLSTEREIVRL